jgi:hypothetical protein
MSAISVCGAYGQLHNVDFSSTNLQLARRLAADINSRVQDGHLAPLKGDIGSTVPGGDQGYLRAQGGLNKYAQGQGNRNISDADGNDRLGALGRGSDTISAGNGDGTIRLSDGTTGISTAGKATVTGGSGNATIFGGTRLSFVGVTGDAMDNGAQGGGSIFRAGSGNETLTGGASAGGQHGSEAFIFLKGETARGDVINNLMPSQDQVDLKGYTQNDLSTALASAQTTPRGMTITLSDKTTITHTDLSSLDPTSFILK